MATRSTIAIQNDDGTVTGIYCHWDGYLSHNGRILKENYNTEAKVRELIALGQLSGLGETIGEKVDFYNAPDGQCIAYGRDRGEIDSDAETFNTWTALLNLSGQEYNYLFVPGEGWRVEYYGRMGDLEEEMVREEKENA
jgi:hypothetical protein